AAGVPVLEYPSGAEPEGVILIRYFGRDVIGQGEDDRLLVAVAVELHLAAGFDIGVIAFTVAPLGFLAVDHRPTQTAGFVVGLERSQIVGVAAAEFGVFLEQT